MKEKYLMPYYGKLMGILLFAFLFLSASEAKAEDIFASLTDLKQVESTYISGRFAHNKKTWQSHSGMRAINLSDGFSSLYTYRCYSQEAVDKARAILKAYLKKHPEMEVVMRTKELSGEYVIYEQFNSEDKLMKMIIWNGEAPNLCEIVVVDWKDGLVRKTSQNEYQIYNYPEGYSFDLSGRIDLSDLSELSGLSNLSELSELSGLSDLSELYDLSWRCTISEMPSLSEMANLSGLSNLSKLSDLTQRNNLKQLELLEGPEGCKMERREGGEIMITLDN